MDKLINYIKELHKQEIELSLKTEFSVHYGWIVQVIRKGYDIPIVEVNNDSLDNAIEITYSELNKLGEIE